MLFVRLGRRAEKNSLNYGESAFPLARLVPFLLRTSPVEAEGQVRRAPRQLHPGPGQLEEQNLKL